jgi:hypothetical protein
MEYSRKIQEEMEILDPLVNNFEVVSYEHCNPFYIPFEGSELKYSKIKSLISDYEHVYILCLSNDINLTAQNKNKVKLFYQQDSDISELKAQANMMSLIKGSFTLVHQLTIRSGLVVIDKNLLEYFNHNCYDLKDKELVYMMLETKESNVKSWLNLYENNNNTLDDFIEKKIFSSYYALEDDKIENHLLSLIDGIDDFKYWQNKNNCLLSINEAFNKRKFNLSHVSKWNLQINEIEKEMKKILQNFYENKTNLDKNTNYPGVTNDFRETNAKKEEHDPLEMKRYVDGSKIDGKSYYQFDKPEDLIISVETVEELLINNSLNEKEKYHLICGFLLSKKYCHYIVNNKKILIANKNLLEKYKPIIRYIMGYTWVTMYMEESKRKTKIKETDRFVFDLDTSCNLPVFPFAPGSPHLNPYFCCMISEKTINPEKNIGSVGQPNEYQNGIVDLSEFRKRLNIFINGNADVDILNGANWTNMAITGGCMAAIIPVTNPLMALFKKSTDSKLLKDPEMDRFYQEYYANSDIDIACNHSNVLDFIENVKHLQTIICNNLGSNVDKSEVKIIPSKSLVIFINAKILKEKCETGEIPYKYEFLLENKNKRSVKFYFYELYLEQKKISNNNNRNILADKINEDEYFEIVNYCDLEKTIIIINNYSFENEIIEFRSPESNSGIEMVYHIENKNPIPKIEEETSDDQFEIKNNPESNVFMKFSETLKYKIESKHIRHTIELFRITDKDFFSCVSRFHLPCVRAYYNGKNCYLLPSAITAYQTLTNIDFKYFVGSRDPICIIDKYRKRGYGTVMNDCEVNQYLSYIMAVDNYKKAYGVKETKDLKSIIGNLDINHDFFKPRKNVPENFAVEPDIKTDYSVVKMNYLSSADDIINLYKKNYSKYSREFLNKRTIGTTGQIEPLKNWMIEASYDLLN